MVGGDGGATRGGVEFSLALKIEGSRDNSHVIQTSTDDVTTRDNQHVIQTDTHRLSATHLSTL